VVVAIRGLRAAQALVVVVPGTGSRGRLFSGGSYKPLLSLGSFGWRSGADDLEAVASLADAELRGRSGAALGNSAIDGVRCSRVFGSEGTPPPVIARPAGKICAGLSAKLLASRTVARVSGVRAGHGRRGRSPGPYPARLPSAVVLPGAMRLSRDNQH
jgi:hypothetical protein